MQQSRLGSAVRLRRVYSGLHFRCVFQDEKKEKKGQIFPWLMLDVGAAEKKRLAARQHCSLRVIN